MTVYNLGGVPKDADTLDGLDSSAFATPAQIDAAVAALVDSSPAALDTLNELAAALNDDANFATTVTNAIAAKADASHTHSASAIASGTIDAARLPVGTTAGTVAAGDDPRFASGGALGAHASTHGTAGSDPISPASIGAESVSAKNAANGYAGLDASTKVSAAQLPTIAVAGGGTGQTTATAGFNALSPATTKGDLVVHTGSTAARQAAGANEQVLVADATQTTGVRWANRARVVANVVGGNVGNTSLKQQVFTITVPAAALTTGSQVIVEYWGTGTNASSTSVNWQWEIAGPNGTLTSANITLAHNTVTRYVWGRIVYNLVVKHATTGWDTWVGRHTVSTQQSSGIVNESGATTYPIIGVNTATNVNTTGDATFTLSWQTATANVSNNIGFIYAQAVVIN